jgi:pyruvate,orthophosphate dikinase
MNKTSKITKNTKATTIGITAKGTKTGTKRSTKTSTATRTKTIAPKKLIYAFAGGTAEGDRTMRDLLGGKGSGLAEMTNAGLPVPPGFTIATPACTLYSDNKGKLPEAVEQ